MNNALLYIGGLLVAILAALFAVPHFIDWNGYRGVFEEEVSRVIGRDVRVGGPVNVRLLPTPYVRFEKVRIAESTGGTGEPFVRVEDFTLWLSVPPLLKGVLEANRIELKRPQIRLNIDAAGRGSWTTLGVSEGAMPFVPAGVSLQSVKIIDGGIAVATEGGKEVLRLDAVDGELEAEALDGPYKFKGAASWMGAARQIRVVTAKPGSDGSVRLKAVVVVPETGNTYAFDGRAADLADKARLDGELQGRIALAGLIGPNSARLKATGPPAIPVQDAAAATTAATSAGAATNLPSKSATADRRQGAADRKADGEPVYADIRSMVAADLTAARLGDITLSIENAGQPQLVTGDARVAWAGKGTTEVALASRWLDLDRLSGRSPQQSPIETAQALVSALLAQLPGQSTVDARFGVEQMTLGGEEVSGFGLKLARVDGPMQISELRVGLPGAARLDVSGTLVAGKTAPELDGPLLVRGASLNRFLAWASKNPALNEGRTDGPFQVRGRLRLGDTAMELTEATAEIHGATVTGEIRSSIGDTTIGDKSRGDRRRIGLQLDGQSIDLGQIWPAAPDWLAAQLPQFGERSGTAAKPGTASRATAFDAARTDLSVRLRAPELLLGAEIYRDVDANVALEAGKLTVSRLRLMTADGLSMDVEGELGQALTEPRGTLRGSVAAEGGAAVKALLATGRGWVPSSVSGDQLAALAPVRLAGSLSVGERMTSAADLALDGVVQGGRLVARARLDGGWSGWREKPADISVTADSPDVERLLRLVLGAGAEGPRGPAVQRGVLQIAAQGRPAEGMLVSAAIESPTLAMTYDGPLKLEAGRPPMIDGEVRLTADAVGEVLALAGVRVGASAAALPIEGRLHVTAKDNVLTMKPRELAIGGGQVAGHAILAQRSDRPSSIAAAFDLGEITLAQLLAPVLEASARDEAAEASPWPGQPLTLQPIERLDGTVEVRFKRLVLDDGLVLADGRLLAKLAPGRIDVEAIEGQALDGRATGTLSISKVPGGFDLTTKLRLADISTARPAGQTPAGAAGAKVRPVTLVLDASARGTGPRTLIQALKGSGRIETSGLDVPGLSPAAVAATAEAFISGKFEPGDGALSRELSAAVAARATQLPGAAYPFEINDGAMRFKPIVATAEGGGRTVIDSTLDLGTLRIDSEWRVEMGAAALAAIRPGPSRAPLPSVFVVYTGRLTDIARLEPRVSAGALERELAVRKMERDLEELERLRKDDERRRAEEEQRQRLIEEERAKAAQAVQGPDAAASAGGASPSAVPGAAGAVAPGAGTVSPGGAGQPVPGQGRSGASGRPAAPASAVGAEAGAVVPPVQPPPPPRPVRRSAPADDPFPQPLRN